MGGVKLVLKHKQDSEELVFQFPSSPYKEKLLQVLEKCDKKTNGFVSISIDRPYKPRTTGEGSQNNLFWVIATAIANEIGEDVKEVEADLKMRAISKGYPYDVSKITGQPKPWSMKRVNTVQMSYLIDTAYEVCAFLEIVLEPQYVKQEPTETQNVSDLAKEASDIF